MKSARFPPRRPCAHALPAFLTSMSASWSGSCWVRWPIRSCRVRPLRRPERPDGCRPLAGRGDAAAGAGRADGPDRRAAHRHPGHDTDAHPAADGLAVGRQLQQGACWSGLLLGVAGASFAAALPLASRWYPPQYQGLAMGIAGAGNSGTVLATFFGPAPGPSVWGWHAVFGLALVPLLADAAVFLILAKDSPRPAGARPLAATTPTCSSSATPGGSASFMRSHSAASWGWPVS